jgi:predicted ATP-grasp superfamily ATP-dependent carboligase
MLSDIGVEEVILVGSYVGAVGHNDPVSLAGVGTDSVTVIRSGLATSNYQGPTGIIGVIQGACKEAGIRALSIWAAAPPYLAGNPYPRAVLAVVEKISDITNLHIDTSVLITVDAEYTQKVDAALEDAGAEISDYLEEIEEYDEPILGLLDTNRDRKDRKETSPSLDPAHADELVDEIVKFLEGDA